MNKIFGKFINVIVFLFFTLMFGILIRAFFPDEVIKTEIITIYNTKDSIVYRDSLIPYKVKVPGDIKWDTVYIPADTAKLIAKYKKLWMAYYTENNYKDSINIDTIGNVKVNIKITQNKLDSLTWDIHYSIPYTYETKTIYPKHQFYTGLEIGKNNISPIVSYNRNNQYEYFVKYNTIKNEFSGGILININRLW